MHWKTQLAQAKKKCDKKSKFKVMLIIFYVNVCFWKSVSKRIFVNPALL